MARIVNQHNILQPLDRETKYTTAKNKSELLKEIQYDCIAYELRIYKNGILELEDFEVSDTDYILVQVVPKGGGGGILRVVAMIGIAVLAAYTGGLAAGLMGYAQGTFAYAATAGIVAAGVSVAGGMLVNAILPPPTPNNSFGNTNLEASSTYSWDSSYNKSQQGTPIPKVFGTHKVTPPIIAKYIESIDDKQYFHGLYALNDGQIANISNIKINDESIDNFDNVSIDIRYGTNDQLVIPDFATTRFDKSVNQKLSTDFDTTTSEDGITELTAVIYFPRGLYYMNDSAQVVEHSVKLVIEYSADGTNWTPITSNTSASTYSEYYRYIGDETNDYYQKYNSSGVFISNISTLPTTAILLPKGTVTPIGTAGKIASTIYATVLSYTLPYETITAASTSAFRKTFTKKYLTAGTYQVRARLYEAPLSGSRYGSDVYFEYLEMGVNDGFIYPNTALLAIRALATDQLSGSTPVITCNVTANSDNPSLISQTILNEVSNITSFDSTFSEFETECNTQNYKCNIVFDSIVNVRQALDLVTLNGRASIQQFGSKYAVIMDKKDILPTQVFTFGMGNILTDTFKQSYLPINDRANIIQVSYYDKNDNYNRTVVEISNTTYDTAIERKTSELNLIGCTDRTQAVRHANYQLKCNRYLSETVQFEAFHDSLVCKYGDIVGVSHDLPQYGYSGRIISCNSSQIVLDKAVTFIVGKTYAVLLRNKNNQIQEITVTGTGTTSTLTVAETLNYTFELYDNYMFGEINKTSKLFRVVNIATGSDLTRQLTCIEYNANIYDDGATVNIPIISDLGLKNLYISDYIRYKQNSNEIETVVNLKWTGVSLKYKIYREKGASGSEFLAEVNDTSYDFVTQLTGNHTFKIVDTNGKSISQTYNILGKLAKPTDINNLTISESGNLFKLNWTHENKDIDFKEYQIFLNGSYIGSTTELFFEYKSLGLDAKYFTVKSIDTSNILSDGVSISLTAQRPSDVKNFRVDNAFNTRKVLSWDYTKGDDFKSFEIRMATGSVDVWENAISIHNGDITQSPFVWDYAGYKEFTLFIKSVDSGGNYSLNADRILFNVGDMNLDNILSTVSQQTSWTGTLTNGTVSGSKLLTLADDTKLYYQTLKYGKSSMFDGGLLYEENNFYSGVASNYLFGRKVPILDYTFYTNFPIGGNIKFTYDILGDFTLKYVLVGGNSFYTNNANNKYNGGNLYSEYTNYSNYNKPFTIEDNSVIKWQLNSTGGALEATQLNMICDVEDKYELFNDKVIPVGGIEIAPTQSFYQIQNVLVTLQGQGIPRVTSKNPTGATIQIFNASGTDIGGVADIQYKGY